MRYRLCTHAHVTGRRVLLRAGFDVPVRGNGAIADTFRIERSLPTIRWLLRHGAKTVIFSHRGQPHGKVIQRLSLRPVARELSRLLKQPVLFANLKSASDMRRIERMRPGDVALLENIRFDIREHHASMAYARQVARLGDLYINDDFSTSHRSHMSIAILPTLLPAYAGLNLDEEVRMLDRLKTKPKRPFIAVIGGGKVYDKLGTVRQLLPYVDHVLVGGAVASTMLREHGFEVGSSLVDNELTHAELRALVRSKKIVLPVDVVIGIRATSSRRTVVPVGAMPKNQAAFDIGPKTIMIYANLLRSARTVFWSGPPGYAENSVFRIGTRALANAISPRRTFAVVGGGDTLHVLRAAHLTKHFTFLSTGGSAMLHYLSGKKLPGLTALKP